MIIGQVLNQGKLGKVMLKNFEKVDIETETNSEYVDLVDGRWQEYDKVFIMNKNPNTPMPTLQICSKLIDFCEIQDPIKLTWICADFIKHLDSIKHEAIEIGLLK